jgi:glycosyltransferase involved in cell wall biosynthesis
MVTTKNDTGDATVSIIIPAYNADLYLDRTLCCARIQTHKNTQILVIDDGSTDGTSAIAKRHAGEDPRIQVISTENRGVAAARNLGISTATGEYVAFLDADDLWHPTKLEKQLAALHGKPESWAAAYAYFRSIDAEDFVTGGTFQAGQSGYIFGRHLSLKYIGNGSSLLVRRKVAQQLGGFDPSYAAKGIGGCEDLDFEVRLAEKYRLACVPEWLVGYRFYEGNMSSNSDRMARSMIAVIDACFSRNPGLHPFIRRHAVASAHVYAARNFLRAKRFRESAASTVTVAANDWGTFLALLDSYRATAWGKLEKAVDPSRRRLSLGGPAVPFLDVDPRSDLTPLKRNRRRDAFAKRCEILDAEQERTV